MSIERIKKEKYYTNDGLEYRITSDVEFLLAENQRLVEALEKIANHPTNVPPAVVLPAIREIAFSSIEAYKLLERKEK